MKSVLISIQPKWVEKICHEIGKDENGKPIYEKRIEVRKTAPKEVPFKAYIYCTIGNGVKGDYLVPSGIQCGEVIGEFVCDKVYLIKNQGSMFSVADEEQSVTNEIARQSCLDYYDMVSYLGNKYGYAWHISDLQIYDKPKELSDFKMGCKGCKERDTYHCKFYCYGERPITRPPQSYMFVKELGAKQ